MAEGAELYADCRSQKCVHQSYQLEVLCRFVSRDLCQSLSIFDTGKYVNVCEGPHWASGECLLRLRNHELGAFNRVSEASTLSND